MRILVSGGSGLIGAALAKSLRTDGIEVAILSRSGGGVAAPGVQRIRWDGRTAEGWWQQAQDYEAWVHLAGDNVASGRWTARKKSRIRGSRMQSGQAIVEAVRRCERPPRVLLQASGVGYYGARTDARLDESAAPGSDFLARVAVEWEASTQAVEARGVRRAILRTGVVLSREGGAFPKLVWPIRCFLGGPLGDGRQALPWIHVEDEVRAIRFLLDDPAAEGPFNLTATGTVTQLEFVRRTARRLRRPAITPAPAFFLRLALGEMSEMLLGGQWAAPRRLLDLGFQFRFPDLDPALADLLRRPG